MAEGYQKSANQGNVIFNDIELNKNKLIKLNFNEIGIGLLFSKQFFEESWARGFNCRKMYYAQGTFYTLMTNDNLGKQFFYSSIDFPDDIISQEQAKNAIITSIDYFNGMWYLIMTYQNTKITQRYRKTRERLKVADYSNITNISYGQGEYVTVSTLPNPFLPDVDPNNYCIESQFIITDNFPKKTIDKYLKKGFFIEMLECSNGFWFVNLTNNCENRVNPQQKYIINNNFPLDKIQKYDADGYKIYNVAFGNGKWIVVLNK